MSEGHVTATTSWKRESGFIWSMLGSAIGFANLLSFSSECYRNGGGAFLIPYLLAVFALGLPMLFLEGAIGHRLHLPIVAAYGSAAKRIGKFFGWLSICAVITIGGFYLVLTGYSVAYAYFFGARQVSPNTEQFWFQFLGDTGRLGSWGNFSWIIFLFAVLVGLFSWLVLVRNIRSGIERICSIFLPILLVLVFAFAVVAFFLPGATIGFSHYLRPDFSKLMSGTLWRDVFGQVFFSFSLGLGIVTGYSRHAREKISIPRAMFFVALGDVIVSVIAGFAVFGCIGYLSHLTGTPFDQIVRSGSSFEIGFIVFPKILQTLTPLLTQWIGVLFFFSVFIAGVTGVFSIIESITGNIEIEFGKRRSVAASLAALLITVMGVLFCFGNSQQLLGALAPMVLGNNMLLGGIAEIIVFIYFSEVIRNDRMWYYRGRRIFFFHLLQFAVPVALTLILSAVVLSELAAGFGLAGLIRWGWFIIACLVSLLLTWHKPVFDECTVSE